MLVLMLHYLLTHEPKLPPKPMPKDLTILNYDEQETLEEAAAEADIYTRLTNDAAQEQKEAEAAWKINEFLDKVEIKP